MKSLLYSLLICLSFELILSWHLNTNINIKNTMPTSSSSSSSSSSSLSSPSNPQVSSISSMPSISPSVLKMIKNDRLSLQINANLMFTNLLLVQSKPYRPSSLKLLSAISSSILSKDSQIYEKVKRIFTIIDPFFAFLKNAMITLILFIKSKFGIIDHEDTKKEVIAVNQDKDIQKGRKWTSNKIREIEQREGLKNSPKKTSIKIDSSQKLKDITTNNAKKYWPADNVKPPLPKRTYSTNTTEDLEKFWPPSRYFNMTIGGGEKLARQSVPLLIPNPTKVENNETKIQSLSNEIKALSQEIQQAQQVEESKEDEIIDPISELQETIEAIVDEHIGGSKHNLDADIGLKPNLTVDVKLSDISLDVIANLTQNNVLTEYGIIDLSSKIFLNNTLGIWKLQEHRLINGLICETMVDRIILKDKEQIYSTEIPGSKGISWSFDEQKLEMKILRGTSSTEYIRDNSGKLTSVKVTRPPTKGPFDRTPTMVNYRGYLLGDRIIGDIFTSSYAMGNITTEETLSGKFQLQRYTLEEMSFEKKSLEVKENLKLWNEIKK